ncbi:hypothetical protein ACFL2C_00695 [Patescibacteria group bacterium]
MSEKTSVASTLYSYTVDSNHTEPDRHMLDRRRPGNVIYGLVDTNKGRQLTRLTDVDGVSDIRIGMRVEPTTRIINRTEKGPVYGVAYRPPILVAEPSPIGADTATKDVPIRFSPNGSNRKGELITIKHKATVR